MAHVVESVMDATLTMTRLEQWATRTFVSSGIAGMRAKLPRRGDAHDYVPELHVRGRHIDRKRSRRGAVVVHVVYS